MLYIASVPGFVLALGMEFAVDSPRWLCKVRLSVSHYKTTKLILLHCSLFFSYRLGDLAMLKK